MPRKKREGVKEKIIETAIMMIGYRSYSDITVDDIAKNTGIAKGSIYQHFKSKEELFINVIDYFYSILIEELSNILNSNLTVNHKMNTILQIIQSYYTETLVNSWTGIIDLIVNNKQIFKQPVHENRKKIINILNAIIKEGQNKGIYRTDLSTEELSRTIWSIIDGYFIEAIIESPDTNIVSVITSLITKK